MEKIDLRKASTAEKEAIRIRAIIMYKQKIKQKEIAHLLGVHKNSIYQWIKIFKEQGKIRSKRSKEGSQKRRWKASKQ